MSESPDQAALRAKLITQLQAIGEAYQGHLPHEGRAWSACLVCQLEFVIANMKDGGPILMPAKIRPAPAAKKKPTMLQKLVVGTIKKTLMKKLTGK
jgi:hypothetical protein